MADLRSRHKQNSEWGDLQVEHKSLKYRDGLAFSLELTRTATPEQKREIEELLESWFLVGFLGGYGSRGIGRGVIHSITLGEWTPSGTGETYKWQVDMGSASDIADEVLYRCLNLLISEGVSIERLVVGTDPDE